VLKLKFAISACSIQVEPPGIMKYRHTSKYTKTALIPEIGGQSALTTLPRNPTLVFLVLLMLFPNMSSRPFGDQEMRESGGLFIYPGVLEWPRSINHNLIYGRVLDGILFRLRKRSGYSLIIISLGVIPGSTPIRVSFTSVLSFFPSPVLTPGAAEECGTTCLDLIKKLSFFLSSS